MKKSLIILLAAVIGAGAFSCSKDLTEEAPLIDMGGSDQGGSSGNPYWDWADKFPGIVSSGIERVFGVQVPVKGGYEPLAFAPDSAVLQRTGLYVASGDQVEIVVPEGTDDLQYQIGIGHQRSPDSFASVTGMSSRGDRSIPERMSFRVISAVSSISAIRPTRFRPGI